MGKNKYLVLAAVLLTYCLSGCGTEDALWGQESNLQEQGLQQESSTDIKLQENVEALQQEEFVLEGEKSIQETENGTLTAETDGAEYDFGPVSYDLTKLPTMENRMYAVWDDKIYYRQYSDEDVADGGLWAVFSPVANTEKALMCMENDGSVTQTGIDYGFGALFIVDGRMYSQRYMREDDYYEVYSCELDGSDVRTYGAEMVLAVRDSKVICKSGGGIAFIDTQTGQERILVDTNAWYLDATEEEIFFYGYQEDEITQTSEPTLYSVDYAGGIRALKTITNNEYTACMEGMENWFYNDYPIDIPYFRVMGDDLYFSAGAYNGNGHMYSGGPVYSMKKDGSDCNVEVLSYDRFFYLYDDGENRGICISGRGLDGHDGKPVQNQGDMRMFSLYGEIPRSISIPRRYVSYDEPYADTETNSVLFYPDTSGICYVLLTAQECEELSIQTYADGSLVQQIEDVEYIDGRLFFTVTDLTYNGDKSIGWRDYYDRDRRAYYCKDLESGKICLLYEY